MDSNTKVTNIPSDIECYCTAVSSHKNHFICLRTTLKSKVYVSRKAKEKGHVVAFEPGTFTWVKL